MPKLGLCHHSDGRNISSDLTKVTIHTASPRATQEINQLNISHIYGKMETRGRRILSFLGRTYYPLSPLFKSQFQLLDYSVTQQATTLAHGRRAFMLNFIHSVNGWFFFISLAAAVVAVALATVAERRLARCSCDRV